MRAPSAPLEHHALDSVVDAVIAAFAAWTIGYDISFIAHLDRLIATVVGAVLIAATLTVLGTGRRARTAVPRIELGLVLLGGLLLAVIVVFVRSPNADDTYYVNRALHIAMSAGPYAHRDTMFANQLYPNILKPDLAASYEALVGTVAWLTHVNVLTLYYIVFPIVVSFLGIFTLWRLARTARANVAVFAVAVAGLVTLLNTHGQGWGGWTVLRLYQGKAALPFLLVPWLWHHVTADADRGIGTWIGWTIIGSVAAVGFSSSGAFVTPIVVAAAALTIFATKRDVRFLVAGVLACVYPLAAAAAGGSSLSEVRTALHIPTTYRAMSLGLGTGGDFIVLTIVALAGWLFVRDRNLRYAFALAVAMLVVLLSPIGLHVLGRFGLSTAVWRVLWALPLPLIAGLAADATISRGNAGKAATVAIVIVLVAGMYGGPKPVLGNTGDLSRRPAWDVEPVALASARRLESIARNGTVAAPEAVSKLIAETSVRVFDVVPRQIYSPAMQLYIGPRFRSPLRVTLHKAMNGTPEAPAAVALAVRTFHVKAACTRHKVRPPVRHALRAAGLRPVGSDPLCTFWSK